MRLTLRNSPARAIRECRRVYAKAKFAALPVPKAAYEAEKLTADIFLPLGGNCIPARNLRRNNLRICATPIDWVIGPTLDRIVRLYSTRFADFFVDIIEETPPGSRKPHRIVRDVANGVVDPHHFPFGTSTEDGRNLVRSNVMRRFERVEKFLKQSAHAAFVSYREDGDNSFREFSDAISDMYKVRVTHINVIHNPNKRKRIVRLNGGNVLYEYSLGGNPSNGYYQELCEPREWAAILNGCELSGCCLPEVSRRGDD